MGTRKLNRNPEAREPESSIGTRKLNGRLKLKPRAHRVRDVHCIGVE